MTMRLSIISFAGIGAHARRGRDGEARVHVGGEGLAMPRRAVTVVLGSAAPRPSTDGGLRGRRRLGRDRLRLGRGATVVRATGVRADDRDRARSTRVRLGRRGGCGAGGLGARRCGAAARLRRRPRARRPTPGSRRSAPSVVDAGGSSRGSATTPCRPSSCRRGTARTARRRAIRWLRTRPFVSRPRRRSPGSTQLDRPLSSLKIWERAGLIAPTRTTVKPNPVCRRIPAPRGLRDTIAHRYPRRTVTTFEAWSSTVSTPDVDLTYSDVFLVPRRSAVTSRLDVDLSPGDGTARDHPARLGEHELGHRRRAWRRRSPDAAASACCRRTCRCRSWTPRSAG